MRTNCALAFVIVGILAVGQAVADKPSWTGGGKGGKKEHKERYDRDEYRQRDGDYRSSRDHRRSETRGHKHFGDRHRSVAHDYYKKQFRRGHCPPGLAKKRNGCMPPGQAKKWSIGRPLAREVIFYDVPSTIIVEFGPPPIGHRYVRVASDILLIAIGTGMVIDAIEDLGRM